MRRRSTTRSSSKRSTASRSSANRSTNTGGGSYNNNSTYGGYPPANNTYQPPGGGYNSSYNNPAGGNNNSYQTGGSYGSPYAAGAYPPVNSTYNNNTYNSSNNTYGANNNYGNNSTYQNNTYGNAGQSANKGYKGPLGKNSTMGPPFDVMLLKGKTQDIYYQTISFMPEYQDLSLDELRWMDYKNTNQAYGRFGGPGSGANTGATSPGYSNNLNNVGGGYSAYTSPGGYPPPVNNQLPPVGGRYPPPVNTTYPPINNSLSPYGAQTYNQQPIQQVIVMAPPAPLPAHGVYHPSQLPASPPMNPFQQAQSSITPRPVQPIQKPARELGGVNESPWGLARYKHLQRPTQSPYGVLPRLGAAPADAGPDSDDDEGFTFSAVPGKRESSSSTWDALESSVRFGRTIRPTPSQYRVQSRSNRNAPRTMPHKATKPMHQLPVDSESQSGKSPWNRPAAHSSAERLDTMSRIKSQLATRLPFDLNDEESTNIEDSSRGEPETRGNAGEDFRRKLLFSMRSSQHGAADGHHGLVDDDFSASSLTTSSNAPTLTRQDYVIYPSVEQLRRLSDNELSNLERFVVARPGVGTIEWSDVDVRGLVIDEAVLITNKFVAVYPSESDIQNYNARESSHPVSFAGRPFEVAEGEGLNIPARVTLFGLKVSKRASEAKADEYERTLREKENTHFESYDRKGGVWVFHVDHFSSYDADERVSVTGDRPDDQPHNSDGRDQRVPPLQPKLPPHSQGLIGVPSRSRYPSAQVSLSVEESARITNLSSASSVTDRTPLGLCRSFRVGWAPGGALFCGSGIVASRRQQLGSKFSVSVHYPSSLPDATAAGLVQILAAHLRSSHADANTTDGVPSFGVSQLDDFLEALGRIDLVSLLKRSSHGDFRVEGELARLLDLADRLFHSRHSKLVSSEFGKATRVYVEGLARRACVDDWLQQGALEFTAREIEESKADLAVQPNMHPLFLHLTVRDHNSAIDWCLKNGSYPRLATLIAAAAGADSNFASSLRRQVESWEQGPQPLLPHVAPFIVAIYRLLAGELQHPDVANGLHWQRILGCLSFYAVPRGLPLASVLSHFQGLATEGLVQPALPSYLAGNNRKLPHIPFGMSHERNSSFICVDEDGTICALRFDSSSSCHLWRLTSQVWSRVKHIEPQDVYLTRWRSVQRLSPDLCYEFLRIACGRADEDFDSSDVAGLFFNSGISPHFDDARAPWLLTQILFAAAPQSTIAMLHSHAHHGTKNFMSLLQRQGLWPWSIYVVLCGQLDKESTKKAIIPILVRYAQNLDDPIGPFLYTSDSTPVSEWLTETLLVPQSWLYFARACLVEQPSWQSSQGVFPMERSRLWLSAFEVATAYRILCAEIAPGVVFETCTDDLSIHSRYVRSVVDLVQELRPLVIDTLDEDAWMCRSQQTRRQHGVWISGSFLEEYFALLTVLASPASTEPSAGSSKRDLFARVEKLLAHGSEIRDALALESSSPRAGLLAISMVEEWCSERLGSFWE